MNLMNTSQNVHILTTKQAAEILDCSVASVVRACDRQEINHFRTPGGHRRIHMTDLRYYMAHRAVR